GSVPLKRTQTVRPPSTHTRPATTLSTLSSSGAPVQPSGPATAEFKDAMLSTPAGAPVQLRALVVALDTDDWGVATWKATLDRVGAAYDVLYSKTTALTASTLVRADAVGKYNAILLTSSMLLYFDSGSGSYVSGLDADEWNTLWAYERDYAVRQAT